MSVVVLLYMIRHEVSLLVSLRCISLMLYGELEGCPRLVGLQVIPAGGSIAVL